MSSFTVKDFVVGEFVTYIPSYSTGHRERGIVTSTNNTYVFVRYDGDTGSKATYPANLKKGDHTHEK
jgi:hypothetical protein